MRQAIPAEPDRLEQALTARRLPDQERVRRAKLEPGSRSAGIDPYPVGYPRTHALSEVRAGAGHLPAGTRTPHVVSVVGRVHAQARPRRARASSRSATARATCR